MKRPSWKVRRRIIHSTLLFCAGCVIFIMAWGSPARSSVHEIIVMCSFGLAFATIGSYIFGAVWDDNNFMSAITKSGKKEDTSSDLGAGFEEEYPRPPSED